MHANRPSHRWFSFQNTSRPAMVSLTGLMPFFLFPRVKSEAIVARREPKEEVEDVSSYLCTELVYYITKMPAGKGGFYILTLYYFMCISPEMQIDLPSLMMRAKLVNCRLLVMSIANRQVSWHYLFVWLSNHSLTKMSSQHSGDTVHNVASAEWC